MNFNNRLINSVINVYSYGDASVNNPRKSNVNFDKYNAYNHLCEIEIGDKMCIPAFAKGIFEYWINNINRYNLDYKKLIIPMYMNGPEQTRRTADSIINDFFRNTRFYERLRKVVTNKDEVFYGNKGSIFDKDMNPLVVSCINCERLQDPESLRGMSTASYKYTDTVLKVNPLVFLNQDSIINKAIIKKIIPITFTYNTLVNSTTEMIGFSGKTKVEICDFKDMFFSPNIPTPNKCSDEILNSIVRANKNEILDGIGDGL